MYNVYFLEFGFLQVWFSQDFFKAAGLSDIEDDEDEEMEDKLEADTDEDGDDDYAIDKELPEEVSVCVLRIQLFCSILLHLL